MISRPPNIRIALTLIAAVVLSACSLATGTRGEVAVYTLDADTPADGAAAPKAAAPVQLLVALPVASGPLAGSRIVVRPGGGEVGVLAGAHWAADLPELLQRHLARRLQQSGRFAAVAVLTDSAHGDLVLAIDLARFELAYGSGSGGDQARLDLTARFIRPDNGHVLATRSIDLTRPVAGRGSAAIVGALQALADQAAAELADSATGVDPRKPD